MSKIYFAVGEPGHGCRGKGEMVAMDAEIRPPGPGG
jgi:hypothetical protein